MNLKDKIAMFKDYCQREWDDKPRCKEQCYFCSEFQKDPEE